MTTINVDVPVLSTPRLILRGHRLEDFEACVEIWSDPVVRKYFGTRPFGREDIWAQFLRQFGMWAVMGYGSWAVEEKETGAYIGRVGVFEVKRGIDPALDGMPEAGWTLASRVHGKGYATEAMQAVLAWADAHLGMPRTFCIIAPVNVASIRVAEKCGFRHTQDAVYKDEPMLVFTREPR